VSQLKNTHLFKHSPQCQSQLTRHPETKSFGWFWRSSRKEIIQRIGTQGISESFALGREFPSLTRDGKSSEFEKNPISFRFTTHSIRRPAWVVWLLIFRTSSSPEGPLIESPSSLIHFANRFGHENDEVLKQNDLESIPKFEPGKIWKIHGDLTVSLGTRSTKRAGRIVNKDSRFCLRQGKFGGQISKSEHRDLYQAKVLFGSGSWNSILLEHPVLIRILKVPPRNEFRSCENIP